MSLINNTLYLSRTALEHEQTCPRLYYLHYHLFGPGISPVRTNADISIGIARHAGVAALFGGVPLEAALKAADDSYLEQVAGGLEGVENDVYLKSVTREHRGIIEAGLHVWAKLRLPVYLQNYKVRAVEQERSVEWPLEMLEEYGVPTGSRTIFEGRIDAELESNHDGKIYSFSLKNPREYHPQRHPDCMIDMQGKSETFLVGEAYGHELAGGVLMEYVMAGTEKEDKFASGESGDGSGEALVQGVKIRWTPLIRGWMRAVEGAGMEYAWRYKFDNPLYNPAMPWSKTNCKEKTFTKSQRIEAWDYPGGIPAWIDALLARQFIPKDKDPLDEILFSPAPYFRSPERITSWLWSTHQKSLEIHSHLAALAEGRMNLDQAFPMHETSCINKYGKRCPMWRYCHEGASAAPLQMGYKLREPHHVKEFEALQEAQK